MVPVIERPKTADQFDGLIVNLDDYSIDEQVEYWKKKHLSVKFMHDRFPDAFEKFVDLYGRDIADEILAIA